MGWRMKAILGLLIVLEAVNCAQLSLKDARIDDLEGQQIINRSRLENWQTRAMRDEQTIEDLQKAADEAEVVLPDGLELVDAGEFECTAYCGEKYPHICGEGKGITASGAPFTPDQTVAADQSIFPFGTVLYIEGVGKSILKQFAEAGAITDVDYDNDFLVDRDASYGDKTYFNVNLKPVDSAEKLFFTTHTR